MNICGKLRGMIEYIANCLPERRPRRCSLALLGKIYKHLVQERLRSSQSNHHSYRWLSAPYGILNLIQVLIHLQDPAGDRRGCLSMIDT
jgi:hypothetical protein